MIRAEGACVSLEDMTSIIDFDLDRYIRTSGRLDLSSVRWRQVREHPLSTEETRVLRYMMDIESHTVIFLRDALATHAAFDPDITAFMTCWNFEELWHGEAFSRLLGEAGVPIGPDAPVVGHDSPYPSRRVRDHGIRRRLGGKGYISHIGTLLGSALADKDFTAIHMTWGAVNELTTLTAYQRMIAKTDNAPLVDILRAIIKQERRHFAFYRAQAKFRLERERGRKLTRWTMDHLWAPVGTGVRPQGETDFIVNALFNDPDGLVTLKEMDGTIARLPGLEGTSYLTTAAEQAAQRLGVPFGL
ncbi:MAG: ferritin-like domain-containing protein [Actinomycetota bacterium]